MSLIPEAKGIKKELLQYDGLAKEQAARIAECLEKDGRFPVEDLCLYIGYKYLIPGEVNPADTLEELGKKSLEFVRKNGNVVKGMDVLPHCGSASSATHKKILLLLAIRREMKIDFTPDEGADCETVRDLADLIARAKRQDKEDGAGRTSEGTETGI